jgi:hypothetical protein
MTAPLTAPAATCHCPEIREAVARLCADFPGEHWRALDRKGRPSEAPISTNLILAYLAEHVLGLPRSY